MENAYILKVISYIILSFAGLFVVLFTLLFRKIRLATSLFACAIDFVKDNSHIFLLPCVFSIILCLYWAYWIVVFIFVYSYGNIRRIDIF